MFIFYITSECKAFVEYVICGNEKVYLVLRAGTPATRSSVDSSGSATISMKKREGALSEQTCG